MAYLKNYRNSKLAKDEKMNKIVQTMLQLEIGKRARIMCESLKQAKRLQNKLYIIIDGMVKEGRIAKGTFRISTPEAVLEDRWVLKILRVEEDKPITILFGG